MEPPPPTVIREPALPRKELRIVLLYVFFASLWMVGSDMIIEWVETHPTHATRIHMFKGLNFVGTTAVLLYIVLQRSFNRWRRAEHKVRRSSDQLRALSAKLQFLREEERSRIAREIHDELGQMLTALKMDLRWIEGRLSHGPDTTLNPVLEKVVEAGEMADATIASVQRISTELRPGVLDELGLCAAVRHEATRFQERTGVVCRAECPDESTTLSREAATTVFRILQEALTNVARHAQATQVSITLRIDTKELRLEIIDNGKGIKSANLDDPKSLGLLGMNERAMLLGGEVDIRPGAQGGTVVRLQIPINVDATSPALAFP